ncbi:MAG TPA: sulfotransferase family protein [Phycisphaerales bacterium]|nr:sulfotransferase family protein [Phycisphaerales bacterium]
MQDVQQALAMAQSAFAAGDWSNAGRLFEQVSKHQRRNAEVFLAMGICSVRIGQLDQARRYLNKAVKLKPMMPESHAQLGDLERAHMQRDAAIAHYERALAIKPGFGPAVVGLASIRRQLGDYEGARSPVDAAIQRNPAGDVHLADAAAMVAHDHETRQRAISMLRKVLDGDLPDSNRSIMLFRLAGLLDREGDYDEAWRVVTEANGLKAVAWDAAGHTRKVEAFCRSWDAASFGDMPRSSNLSEQPVFVAGMPRSGTSLVEQIIASHPAGAGVGELPTIPRLAVELDGLPTSGPTHVLHRSSALTSARLDEAATKTLDELHRMAALLDEDASAERIVDKLPGNIAHLPLIALLFPKARIIHTTRDPRDVAISCYFQDFAGPLGYAYSLESLASFIADEHILVNHARDVLGIEILDLSYEHLVADPERQIRRLLDFLGLPFDPACLSFHTTTRSVATASTDQVRQPMYRGSLERWKRYEPHLGPLIETLGARGIEPGEIR